MLKLYNSLSKQIEEFKPIDENQVGFYSCGPTVYDFVHIGNLRSMILADVLHRVLQHDGYKTKFVMNVTDVGHLASDSDTGDDKMERNAKTPQDVMTIADKFTKAFLSDLKAVNILNPDVLPKASDHIPEQIEMIKSLIKNGFAYVSDDAVYFDVAKAKDYTRLVGQDLADMLLGARQEVVKDPNKHNPYDFVLWFKAVGRYANHILRWASPWGEGFPGWHIECSAMSKKYLGEHFDIHVGGIDLKFPHHTNEIAQSESFSGKPFVNYWVHGEHLLIGQGKMAKSEGNFLTLQTIIDKGFNPLAYRYLTLTSHYRSKLNFTWESLTAAQNALNNLYQQISIYDPAGKILDSFEESFHEAIDNDLDMPAAIATMWDMIKSENESADKLATLIEFDRVFGLKIEEVWKAAKTVPDVVSKLVEERELARKQKDFAKSDELRKAIESNGYVIEDTPDGVRVKKKF